jgi:hypothetical protein
METPNLYNFATSELSQDAFICWLLSWADPRLQPVNEALHRTATKFLDKLLELGKQPIPERYQSISIERQYQDVDVFVVINGQTAIIIEDKVQADGTPVQLNKYMEAIRPQFKDKIAAIYLKTGDQSNYRRVVDAGYAPFKRADFLELLNHGEQHLQVKNNIFSDFHRYLRSLDDAVRSYQSVALEDWNKDWRRWMGFFVNLQTQFPDGEWHYVPNRSGGFMGFWWHWNEKRDKYLQLENEKLCFKIQVNDKEKSLRTKEWLDWYQALLSKSDKFDLKFRRGHRRLGTWMTVAFLGERKRPEYRQANGGILDFDQTVQVLKRADALMDAALGRT